MGDFNLFEGIIWYIVFLFSTTLHEAAHAFVAHQGGDSTAHDGGQVTLNPEPHIRREPFGMVVIPVLTYFIGGWMLGWASAPYDPYWANRYPKRAAFMALAGPLSNLALVVAAGLIIWVGVWTGLFWPPMELSFDTIVVASDEGMFASLATFVSILFSLNLLLFVFNLIPVPPLDGSAAIGLLVDDDTAREIQAFMQMPMVSIFGILIAWRAIDFLLWPVFNLFINLLYPGMYN